MIRSTKSSRRTAKVKFQEVIWEYKAVVMTGPGMLYQMHHALIDEYAFPGLNGCGVIQGFTEIFPSKT